MRVAMIAGRDIDQMKLTAFLQGLRKKYPDCTIITGNGIGGESRIKEFVKLVDMKLEVPEQHPEWFGEDAGDCQVNDIMLTADVIVTVGSRTAERNKIAEMIYKRMDAWRGGFMGGQPRPRMHIAELPKEEAAPKPRKPTKSKDKLL